VVSPVRVRVSPSHESPAKIEVFAGGVAGRQMAQTLPWAFRAFKRPPDGLMRRRDADRAVIVFWHVMHDPVATRRPIDRLVAR
jgi:hypothetical protein